MKTNLSSITYALIVLGTTLSLFNFTPPLQKLSLTQKWKTDTLLKTPESVIYDETSKTIYAANINGKPWEKDDNGFISKISLNGKIENLHWINGLNAPKGMGIYKGKLYIADINSVAIADIKTGKIEKVIDVPGAQTLNDITIDKDGNVYISDSAGKKVFILKDNQVSVWAENTNWKRPNGLLALKNNLFLVDAEGGGFYAINYSDKASKINAQGLTKGDGIVEIGKDEFLISNWNGEVSYVKDGKVEKILDTKEAKLNAADIWYIPTEKLLIIPTFLANSVTAYQLNKN